MAQANGSERDLILAEEAFVVDAQALLHELMETKGVSRSQLAAAMNVSRARITQILSDECKNFTVRLFARAMFALGERAEVTCSWMADREAAAEKANKRESILKAPNVHELWTDTAIDDEPLGSCSDDDYRIDGLLLEMAA